MVSGFLTSPCDHLRMSSTVARPIRSSSNTLTSSKVPSFLRRNAEGLLRDRESDLFDRAGLEAAGQVDAELLGGPVHVVVGVAHLDRDTVRREHLDVEAQRLQL